MPVPIAPTNLRPHQYLSGTSVQLYWIDRSTDEDGFVVERQLEGEADFTAVGLANAANGVNNAVLFTDTGLPVDVEVAYRVRAVNALGSSGYTDVYRLPTAPAAPTDLTAAAVAGTDNQIRLTWTDRSRRELGFQVYRKNPGATTFTHINTVPAATGAGSAVTYTDVGVTAGAVHEYYVRAYNEAGPSGDSNYVTVAANAAVAAPAAPGTPGVWQYVSGTAFRLYFRDNSTNEDAFLLERKSQDESDYAVVATLPAAVGAGSWVFYDVAGLAPDTSYSFRVRARNSVGNSAPTDPLVFASVPAAPADLAAAPVAGTDNQIRLTWTDRSRTESRFRVYRRGPGSADVTPFDTTSGVSGAGAGVSYVDSTVTAGGAYEYSVTAYNDAGESGQANRAAATGNPTAAAPAAPNFFQFWGYLSATSLQFRFRDNSTNEDGFVVERKTEDAAEYTVAATAPSVPGVGGYALVVVSDFAPNSRYTVRIRARNAVGTSAPSDPVTVVTLPAAPTDLAAAAVAGTDNQIRLTWTDASRSESGFRVYRKNPGADGPTPIDTVPAAAGTGSTVTYTDRRATAGGTHEYHVTAYNDAGESGASNRVAVAANAALTAPAAPDLLQLWSYLSATSFQFRFRDNSTNEDSFVVEQKAEDAAEYVTVLVAPALPGAGGHPVVTVTGLTAPDTRYSVRVKARNRVGDSAPSDPATVDTVPAPASNLAATALSSAQVRLTWTNNSRYATSFLVSRKSPGATTFGPIGTVAATAGRGGTITYVDVGLAARTRYEYQVVAQNSAGAATPSESAAVTTSALNAPGTPTDLTATPVQRQVTLRWLDRSTDEALFVVERRAEGEATFAQVGTAPARPGASDFVFYPDAELAADRAFAYRVKARNPSGDSDYTNVATATTTPAAPVDLVATPVPGTDTQIRLAWTNTSKHPAGFYVYRKREGEAAFTNAGFVTGAAAVGAPVTFVSGTLIPRTTYTYYVVAYNDAGESPRSNEASATTELTDKPDLQVAAVMAPAEVAAGQAFEVGWTVVNAGAARANGPWVDRVFLSAAARPVGDDRPLAEVPFAGALDAGQRVARTQMLTIPAAVIPADGDYFVLVVADANDNVPEGGREDNNIRAVPVRVRRAALPDLVVEGVEVPATAASGQTITVRWTVRNAGAGATDVSEWYDRVSLAAEGAPSGPSLASAEARNARRLEAGQSYTASARLLVPSDLTGRHVLVVEADSRRLVAEADDTNNAVVRPVELVRPLPNLVVADVAAPAAAAPRASLSVSWRVRNVGPGAAEGGWTDRVYLSRRSTLDASATLLGSAAAPLAALRENEAYGQTLHAVLPRLAPGGYFLIVQTDADGVVAEEKADNTRAVPLELVAVNPLVAAPGQIALTLLAGEPATVEVDLANLGADALADLRALVEGAAPNVTVRVDVPPALDARESRKARITVTAADESVPQSALVVQFSGRDDAQGEPT